MQICYAFQEFLQICQELQILYFCCLVLTLWCGKYGISDAWCRSSGVANTVFQMLGADPLVLKILSQTKYLFTLTLFVFKSGIVQVAQELVTVTSVMGLLWLNNISGPRVNKVS